VASLEGEPGEGVCHGKTLTRPRADARGHPLPHCGRGAFCASGTRLAWRPATPGAFAWPAGSR